MVEQSVFSIVLISSFVAILLLAAALNPRIRSSSKLTMRRFFDKAKAVFDDLDGSPSNAAPPPSQNQQPVLDQPQSSTIRAPTPADVIRYRYHHGTNVGSVFILEKWLTPHMFPESAEGSAERAAVKASVKELGMDGAREKFEHFWATYLSDSDIDWLRDVAKCE